MTRGRSTATVTRNYAQNQRWRCLQKVIFWEGYSSKYKGVSWSTRDKRWVAAIKFNYKRIGLGYHKLETEAAKAYNEKAKELFGEFAWLNTIDERKEGGDTL